MAGVIVAADRQESALPLAGGGFRPDVQALRGVAVLLVVAYHAQVLHGGFVGVDVFFVISGFVIGRSLMAQLQQGHGLSLGQFSARRVRRLLPALALMLTLVVLLAPLLAPVGAGTTTGRTGIAASLFHANFFLFHSTRGGYFGSMAEWNPLLHTWSLSVEEQFYLVLPVALLWLWRLAHRSQRPLRVLRLGVAVVAGASLVACVVLTAQGPGSEQARWAFFASPVRAWEFLAGFALVLLPRPPLRLLGRPVVRLLGLALVAWSSVSYSDATLFPGIAAIVPVAGAALVILGGSASDGAGSVRGGWFMRPLQSLGDLSYSWYLWHWPVIVAAAAFWPTAGRFPLVVAAAMSLLPAWASYRQVELRFRATEPGDRPSEALRLAALCIVVPVVAAAASFGLVQWVDRLPAVATTVGADEPHLAQRAGCNRSAPLGRPERRDCSWGDGPNHIVVIGDSNAGQFGDMLLDAMSRNDRVSVTVFRGCPIADLVVDAGWFEDGGGACRTFVNDSLDHLMDAQPSVVLIANATDKYLHDADVALIDPTDGRRASTPAGKAELFEAALRRSVAQLTGAGIRVAIIETIPKPWAAGIEFDQRSCSALLLLTRADSCTVPPFTIGDVTVDANELERRVAQEAGAAVWDLGAELCVDGRCGGDPRRTIWPESQHIGVEAARGLAPTARSLLDTLSGSPS